MLDLDYSYPCERLLHIGIDEKGFEERRRRDLASRVSLLVEEAYLNLQLCQYQLCRTVLRKQEVLQTPNKLLGANRGRGQECTILLRICGCCPRCFE
jgi:hypothetical protein